MLQYKEIYYYTLPDLIENERNESNVTAKTTEIQRTTRDYCEQLYTNKLDNIEEMDKFLETLTTYQD